MGSPVRKAALLLALAVPARADAGIPMLAVTWPAMLVALLPIIAIEALVLKSRLKLSLQVTAKAAALANVVSTVAGIPVTWLILAVLEFLFTRGGTAFGLATPLRRFLSVTIQAPWLVPYGPSEMRWMVPTAALALIPPFFLASWLLETLIVSASLRKRNLDLWKPHDPRARSRVLRSSVFRANIASYAMLAIAILVWLGISLARR